MIPPVNYNILCESLIKSEGSNKRSKSKISAALNIFPTPYFNQLRLK